MMDGRWWRADGGWRMADGIEAVPVFLTGVCGSGVSTVDTDGRGSRALGWRYSSASMMTSGPSIDDDRLRMSSFSSCTGALTNRGGLYTVH